LHTGSNTAVAILSGGALELNGTWDYTQSHKLFSGFFSITVSEAVLIKNYDTAHWRAHLGRDGTLTFKPLQ
jgi:hypothetical protein